MSKFDINNLPNDYFKEAWILRKFTSNNFMQKLISSFYDYDNLYLVSKFYEGCAYNYLDSIWNEKQIQFFSACLIQSFIALRNEKLIHRDVHFGNLVLDEKQYISLIDFHITMKYKNKDDPKGNIIGTPPLCAPEMIKRLKYDYNSDYYRLGGMIYFTIFKNFPNIVKIQRNLTDLTINLNDTKNFSASCIDFINKLIITDSKKRIGYYSIEELKNHKFFNNFNWSNLIDRKIKSPFLRKPGKIKWLCDKLYNFTTHIFLTTELIKNKTFINIFDSYNNINNDEVEKIFHTFKYSNSKF